MLMCEECGIRPAGIVLTSVINGEKKERHLCPVCFAEIRGKIPGLSENVLPDILKQVAGAAKKPEPQPTFKFPGADKYVDLVCPKCGAAYEKVCTEKKIFCASCAETFVQPIIEAIGSEKIHATAIHRSALGYSGELDRKLRLRSMRERFTQAIKAEEYEEAAALRDAIRKLESEGESVPVEIEARKGVFSAQLENDGYAPENDVVICTFTSISRNAEMCRFDLKDDAGTAEALLKAVTAVITETEGNEAYRLVRGRDVTPEHMLSYVDRHYLPRGSLIEKPNADILIPENGQGVSLIINGRNNIEICSSRRGLRAADTAQAVMDAAEYIGERIGYASSGYFGYTNSDVRDLGTGMHISVVMHLPTYAKTPEFAKTKTALKAKGIQLSGVLQANNRCDIYEMHNIFAIERTEEELIAEMEETALEICAKEREMQARIRTVDELKLEDSLLRAKGILSEARLLPEDECMALLSNLRFACVLGFYDGMSIEDIDTLIYETGNGCVYMRAGGESLPSWNKRDTEKHRADFMRAAMSGIATDLFKD